MTSPAHHRDCRNYAPIDVVKGLCHVNKTVVPGDAEACGDFDRMPKCGHCTRFQADPAGIEMGTCAASSNEPRFFAYPDMVAVTCEHFQDR